MHALTCSLDLSEIADDELTAVLSKRYAGCGKNMPQAAADMCAIVARMTHGLDKGGLTAARRGGLNVVYYGKLLPRPRPPNFAGGLVPVVRFQIGVDGRVVIVSLETDVAGVDDDENFVVAAPIQGPDP